MRGLRELDFQVEQFIVSSTMQVRRPAELGELITEDSPILPPQPVYFRDMARDATRALEKTSRDRIWDLAMSRFS